MTEKLPYLKIPTYQQKINFDAVLTLDILESFVDFVQLPMATSFHSYLHCYDSRGSSQRYADNKISQF